MKKIDESIARDVLYKAFENRDRMNDDISESINSILQGTHKTYRYITFTAILAKATNCEIDILSIQAGDNSDGAYDARSLCHHVVVPFEREVLPGSLGGSNEPYLNKPARCLRLSPDNPVRRGNDYNTLLLMIDILPRIDSEEKAVKYLQSAICCLEDIYNAYEDQFSIKDLDIVDSDKPQTILDYINSLVDFSYEGEICPLIISTLESLYYDDKTRVVPHKVNESGASSKEIGDIDIYDSAEHLISSIEVKDKDFTKEDVEHAIHKFASAKLERTLFVFGKKAAFDRKEVFSTAAQLGSKGYFCSVISIIDFAKMRLYSTTRKISIGDFVELMLDYAKQINAKDETIAWIKTCAIEMGL